MIFITLQLLIFIYIMCGYFFPSASLCKIEILSKKKKIVALLFFFIHIIDEVTAHDNIKYSKLKIASPIRHILGLFSIVQSYSGATHLHVITSHMLFWSLGNQAHVFIMQSTSPSPKLSLGFNQLASGPQAELRSYTFLFSPLLLCHANMMQNQLLKLSSKIKSYLCSSLSIIHPVNKLSTFYAAGAIWEAGINESGKKTDSRKLHSHLSFHK